MIADKIQILKEQPDKLRFIISRLLWRSGLCRLCNITIANNVVINFSPATFAASLWIDPHKNDDDFDFLNAYCRAGDFYVDVGANIGTHGLVASKIVGEQGHVTMFEPHPRIYSYLKKNVALNKAQNITAYNMAIGDTAGQVTLTDYNTDDQNNVTEDGQGVQVTVNTLDSLNFPKIDLLKVDVEGYEECVFLGAPKTLARTTSIVFESSPRALGLHGTSSGELIGILQQAGFDVMRRNNDGKLEIISLPYNPAGWEDLYATRDLEEFLHRTKYEMAA